MHRIMPFAAAALLATTATAACAGDAASNAPSGTPSGAPIEIRAVVVNTFELGHDTGDAAGEAQNWITRYPFDQVLPLPAGYHHLRYNASQHVLEIVTGEGHARTAASIMALGLDPRFDLTHAYWILAGIAGIDPAKGSVGSAAWAEYLVDGGLAYQIDSREIPSDWSTGTVPLGRASPYQLPVPPAKSISADQVLHLNAGFVNWAYQLTRSITLTDTANLQRVRTGYPNFPEAQKPPFVLKGDTLSSDTFWVGALFNTWAENWVTYWTHGRGSFATTAYEDTSYAEALSFLAHADKVDLDRVLSLRTASDYSVPPAGDTPAQLLASEADGTSYSGFAESLDSAYVVGSAVVREIATHWGKYKYQTPSVAP